MADYWRDTLEEALRHIAVRGIDLELQIKAHDEREAAGLISLAVPGGRGKEGF